MIKSFDYLKAMPEIEAELLEVTARVLRSGQLILGPETEAFEREFAEYTGAKHCVGVASGTAALHLALMALGLGPGDEVITVANTCVPTIAAIRLTGAIPVFVDVREEDLMLDPDLVEHSITSRTRCILPVHLWGRAADLARLTSLAAKYELYLVEDCAQAIGTNYGSRQVGTVGDMGCFSFYPTKNLGAMGDAGAIITNSDELADRLRKLRFYGYNDVGESVIEGTNARISEIQAAMLRVKLRRLSNWLARRRTVAAIYDAGIRSPLVALPPKQIGVEPSWHQYVLRTGWRDGLMESLRLADIESAVHYRVPVHRMPVYLRHLAQTPALPVTERAAGEIISLPIHESISLEEARSVVLTINEYTGGNT